MSNVINPLMNSWGNYSKLIDHSLKQRSPYALILGTTVALSSLHVFSTLYTNGWFKPSREQIGNLLLKIPAIRKQFENDKAIKEANIEFSEKTLKKWESYGDLHTKLPEAGLPVEDIVAIIKKYQTNVLANLKDCHFSGTIYSNGLQEEVQIEIPVFNASTELGKLGQKLDFLTSTVFKVSNLWNSLHGDEFPIGNIIDYQVVQMVAKMFGGDDNVSGFVTSGGTESLMLAMRCYANWGREERSHQPYDSVIVAPDTVHASIFKACESYKISLALVKTNTEGHLAITDVENTLKKYGKRVVCIVGSTPSYPTGCIDPITEMAKLALQYNCGLHVDACLGAFVINNLNKYDTNYLSLPGVTSLSADTHKKGWAPKGSSALVMKKLSTSETKGLFKRRVVKREFELPKYSIYSYPDWKGGPYGTPKDAGSQSCVNSFAAFVTLLAIGQEGYKQIGEKIHAVAQHLAQTVQEFGGKLKLFEEPQESVFAIKIHERLGLEKGATYAFAYEMKKRGFVFSTLPDDSLHFCVTGRMVDDPSLFKKFSTALEESITATIELNAKLKKEGGKFPGDAGIYCSLDAAISPKPKDSSLIKYVQKWLFGRQGAKETVRLYFLRKINPFIQ